MVRPPWFHRDLGLASPFMNGDDVTVVQKKTGAAPDGEFGPVTQSHVVSFQSHHGLATDGIVGAQTAQRPGVLTRRMPRTDAMTSQSLARRVK